MVVEALLRLALGVVVVVVVVAVKPLFTVAALDLQAAEESICISASKTKGDKSEGPNWLGEWRGWRGCW